MPELLNIAISLIAVGEGFLELDKILMLTCKETTKYNNI
jgi:hypothetical protein